jgi:hypothetical protein
MNRKGERTMKNTLVLVLAIGTMAFADSKRPAQDQIDQAEYKVVSEWIGTLGTTVATNYYGEARVTSKTSTAPSTNDAVWRIKKTVFDSTGLPTSKGIARGTNGSPWSVAWTNRVAATYDSK